MDKRKNDFKETVNYLIFGVLAVGVNTAVYFILSLVLPDLASNTIAFMATVLFAYWTNSRFVFKTQHTWGRFFSFVLMRTIALPIDDVGLMLLLKYGAGRVVAKTVMNLVVIAFNYLVSKLIIFRK